MAARDDRDILEYLRVFIMVGQKIDFIWGMFLTTYLPVLGFVTFFQQDIRPIFAVSMVLAMGMFTVINARSLRNHYDIANTMSREFRTLNKSYPDLNGALLRSAQEQKRGVVIATHSLAFLGFVYLVATKVARQGCDASGDLACLASFISGGQSALP